MTWLIKGYAYGYKPADPGAGDTGYPVPYIWINLNSNAAFILYSVADDIAYWSVKEPDFIINEGQINQINVIGESNLFGITPGLTGLTSADYAAIESRVEHDLASEIDALLHASYTKEFPFSWGDATPAVLTDMVVGTMIWAIDLVLFEAFDGIAASLSIGITGTPDLFMATSQCDPYTVGVYSVTPGHKCTTTDAIKLFITPGAGASRGTGKIIINY
jgi:hypothetical protein